MFSTPGFVPVRLARETEYGRLPAFRHWAMKGPATCFKCDGGEPEQADIDRLYRSERPKLIRLLSRNRAARPEAEDLAQEAFLRFARASRDGASIAHPARYLRQIGRNLITDRARSSQLRHMAQNPEAVEAAPGTDELRRLEARDKLRRLEHAMLALKPRSRKIFLAHRLEGLSYYEIAEQMGLSVKRIEKIMAKAIADLSRLMEHDA
jgi:RNA polymerase sigma factor (sigma-70 family)